MGLAILPFLGVGGMQIYKAEMPGPVGDKLKPRLKDTAMIFWKVYVFFTVAETILLMLGGMNLLDALCHTFGTLATGGFSTKNASIGYYKSVYIDTMVTIFMLLGGINFPRCYRKYISRLIYRTWEEAREGEGEGWDPKFLANLPKAILPGFYNSMIKLSRR